MSYTNPKKLLKLDWNKLEGSRQSAARRNENPPPMAKGQKLKADSSKVKHSGLKIQQYYSPYSFSCLLQ